MWVVGGYLTNWEGIVCKPSYCCHNLSFSHKRKLEIFLYLSVVNEHSIYFFIFAANVLCTGKTTLFKETGRRVSARSISSTAN